MECSKTQKRLVEVDFGYIDDFLELYNESRRTWKVYFPPMKIEYLQLLLESVPTKCLYAVEQDGVILGYLIGYIHNYFSAELVRVAHHETILVSKKRCKSGYTVYKVTELLIDALIAWAKEQKAHRIVWSSGTGEWRGFEHILARRNAKQIGIVLDMEL